MFYHNSCLLSLLLLINVAEVQCQATIQQTPQNTAALVGTPAHFNCTVSIPADDHMTWYYMKEGGNIGGTKIYDSNYGVQEPDLFTVEVDSAAGTYNLIVKDVTTSLGVKYWCSFVFATPVEASAGLVAMHQLQCPKTAEQNDLFEGSIVNLTCSVDYTGYTNPTLEWRDSDNNVLPAQMTVQNSTRVTAFVNLTLTAEHDDQPLTCLMSFKSGSSASGRTPATNLPSYTDSCHVTFLVIHPVTELSIQPPPDESGSIAEAITVGDELNCTGNGRPEPEYTWVAPDGYTLNSNVLVVTEAMADQSQPVRYMCMAKNMINGETYVATYNVSFTVEVSNTADTQSAGPEAWVIAVAVVVPIVVIAIAVIVGCCFYQRHKSKDKKPKSSSSTTASTPFISPYASGAPTGGAVPPSTTRYPPTTATTNSAFVPVTRTTPTTPGYGDLSGGLNGSATRLNAPPAAGNGAAVQQPRPPPSHHSHATAGSSRSTTPSTTQMNPPMVSMRPDPVSPAPRVAMNPMPRAAGQIYTPVSAGRPGSVTSGSSRATSNYAPSATGGGAVGSARLNYSSSAHGSIV